MLSSSQISAMKNVVWSGGQGGGGRGREGPYRDI